MTQLGEMIAVGVMKLEGSDCPFDHDPGEPPEISNQLKGSGSTLGTSLAGASTTVVHAPNRRTPPAAVPYPPTPAIGSRPISIDGFDYPVTCAAHHLIPAGGSLKHASELLEWMEKSKGVWANLGYDVNGAENGAWLPGNYAVGGNGTGDWVRERSILPDGEEDSAPVLPKIPTPNQRNTDLHGYLHDFDEGRKRHYVLQATQLHRGQFHDAHPDYNDLVLKTLKELGLKYKKRFPYAVAFCPDCKTAQQKRESFGRPTPFKIAHQLNSISGKLRGYLVGSRGHPQVYTSRWGMQADRRGISALK